MVKGRSSVSVRTTAVGLTVNRRLVALLSAATVVSATSAFRTSTCSPLVSASVAASGTTSHHGSNAPPFGVCARGVHAVGSQISRGSNLSTVCSRSTCGPFSYGLSVRGGSITTTTTQLRSTIVDAAQALAGGYGAAMASNPTATRAVTATVLGVAGDAVSQNASPEQCQYDARRAAAFGVFGAIYTGCFQGFLFQLLNDVVPTTIAGSTLLSSLAKTAACQFGSIPLIYYPLFFAISGALGGQSVEATLERARQQFVPLLTRNWMFWWPAQCLQFLFIPLEYQVPYCCVAAFIWNVLLSSASRKMDAEAEDLCLVTEASGD